jgi:hypothetical protein
MSAYLNGVALTLDEAFGFPAPPVRKKIKETQEGDGLRRNPRLEAHRQSVLKDIDSRRTMSMCRWAENDQFHQPPPSATNSAALSPNRNDCA